MRRCLRLTAVFIGFAVAGSTGGFQLWAQGQAEACSTWPSRPSDSGDPVACAP